MEKHTSLLIIGAGPFGLSMAAHAQQLGIDYIIAGKPMEFWEKNMPAGMYLRSACDWHLDADNEHTIEKFLSIKKLSRGDAEPLSLQFYLSHTKWFIEQKKIHPLQVYIKKLDHKKDHCYKAFTNDNEIINAKNVVIATGFKYFKHIPGEILSLLPPGTYSHTCDTIDMKQMKDKRVLIIGGRQSAYEWAALLNEGGADTIHISHRHESPAFERSDWSWVNVMVDKFEDDPLWFHNLSFAEKEAIRKKLWEEGRLKIEPWLNERVKKNNIRVWPFTNIVSCKQSQNGELEITFDNRQNIIVEHIIFATGYKVNISNVPFLANGNILPMLSIQNGFPELDKYFQTNLPGLFIASIPASQDFGPFFGFTIAVRASAKLIGKALI